MTRPEVHEKFRLARRLLGKYSPVRHAALPGFPLRRARVGLRRLGQSHPQRPRLAKALLPASPTPITGRYAELIAPTDWAAVGPGNDPRCEHCLMHCGFEPAAVLAANRRLRDMAKMAVWQMG